MINSLGAAGAARKLLAGHHMLVVTPWLVRRGRPELTLEHEIGQPRWSGLFTDEERAEAARRQARAGQTPQLVINQRQQLLGSAILATGDRVKKQRELTHCRQYIKPRMLSPESTLSQL
jgi:hypothetical protein